VILDKVKQAEISFGKSEKRVDAHYQTLSEELQEGMEGDNSSLAGQEAGGSSEKLLNNATSSKPMVTTLKANYPNPFNPTTTISYQLAKNSLVRLKIYDVLGREVATLVDSNQQKGSHQITFNASQLASGIYFYRLRAGDKVIVKKMLLMK